MLLQSSPNHPTSDIEDVFSSNFLDYTSTSLDYFLVSPRNISLDPSDNLSKYLLASLAISPSHDDPYIQAYIAAANEPPILPQAPIDPPPVLPPSLVLPLSPMFDSRDFFPPVEIPPPKDTKTPVESPIPISLSLLVGSSSPVRSPPDYPFDESIFGVSCTPNSSGTGSLPIGRGMIHNELSNSVKIDSSKGSLNVFRWWNLFRRKEILRIKHWQPESLLMLQIPPLDYPFDESIFAELDNSLLIIPQPLGIEPVPEESNEMAPKRTSTSATSTMTQAAIMKLVSDSIAATLEEVANTAQRLMDQVLKHGSVQGTNDHKRKFDDRRNATSYNNNYPNNNRNNNYHQQQNRRQKSVSTQAANSTKNKKYTGKKRYTGNLPWCTRYTLHNIGIYNVKCQTCNKVAYKDVMEVLVRCWSDGDVVLSHVMKVVVSYEELEVFN
ncbi:hypothetical protein Tco_0569135 [Tanacetum coccineum]